MDLFGEFDRAQGFGLEGDLDAPGGVNLAGLPAKAPKKKTLEDLRRQELAAQQARARQQIQPTKGVGGPMIPFGSPAHQYMQAQSMANNTMQAIADENDSRVAQVREMRRLAASQQSEQMKYDYLLRKLEIEREQMEKERIARRQAETGKYTRTFRNGKWEYI